MSDTPKKFYLTTPIYYVNARPHIGHAYTTIVADVIARRHRLLGDDTFFLTGTDEHGQKIERSAIAAGIPPQQFADQVSKTFRDLWTRMGILDDSLSKDDPLLHRDFIRTTDPRHKQGVQKLFKLLQDRGHIYLSTYTGQYCVSDEAYVDGPPGIRCPDCGRTTETVSESNYYFRLSAFQLPLLNLIESGQLAITPESRRNEVLSFLRGPINEALANISTDPQGYKAEGGLTWHDKYLSYTAAKNPYVPGALKDLSISRTSFHWGVPVPGDEAHVIYVWLDALANYMTAVGYGSDAPEDIAKFKRFWPANLHLVGKEIIRFHCVYWPAFLLALNPQYSAQPGAPGLDPETWVPPEPQPTAPPQLSPEDHRAWAEKMLPKAITAHGWLLFEDSKMSKTRGNIVRTETILDAFGEHYHSSIRRYNEAQSKKDLTFQPVPEPSDHDQDLFATDVLRYFLLREIPFGQDGSFSFDALVDRYNADLTNGYGNLVKRTLTLIQDACLGEIPKAPQPYLLLSDDPSNGFGEVLLADAHKGTANFAQSILGFVEAAGSWLTESKFGNVLTSAAFCVKLTDLYFSLYKPWKLVKSPELDSRLKLNEVLYTAAESIRILTALLYPILPYATAQVWSQLGLGNIEQAARDGKLKDLQWGGLQPGTRLGPLSPIFPRADVSPDKGLAHIMTDMEQGNAPPPSKLSNETATPPTPTDSTHPGAPPRTSAIEEHHPIAKVAGSDSAHTQLPRTPSHTQAFASGPFNTAQSSQPMAQSPIRNPAPSPSSQGQSPIATTSPTPTEGPASTNPPEGAGFSRATTSPAEGGTALPKAVLPKPAANAQATAQITIDDFAKVELRVARILVAERIPKADKLLRLEVDLGPEPGMGRRQILSGIAEWYTPEDLIGRKIIVITNLAPRKMRGLESHGMLLAASSGEDGKPALATFADSDHIEVGARLK